MSLDEGLSRFIGRLYEAVYDEEDWRAVMRELMVRTGSRIAFVTSVDLENSEFSRSFFYAPEESCVEVGMREYAEETYLSDPSLAWASANPHAGMCESELILPRSEYLSDPYIKWQKARFGTTHWRVMYTEPRDRFSFALSLHPPQDAEPPSQELRPLHRMLFEHMERALRLVARPPDFSRDAGAIFALDGHGRIIAQSDRAAELIAKADGLNCDSGHLVASDPKTANSLKAAIKSAIGAHVTGGAGAGLKVRRPSGGPDWLVLTSPYPRFLEHLPVPAPAAIVRVVEMESNPVLGAEQAEIFELTHREIEIATALLGGHSIESLSAKLGMSRNTARVHLQALFKKTGTNRQSDLVRILAEVARN